MTTTQTAQDESAVRAKLLAQVRSYLMEQRGIEADRVSEGTRFREDLELDSLDLAALALEWEDEYGVTIEDERVVLIKTVGEAIDLVLSLGER